MSGWTRSYRDLKWYRLVQIFSILSDWKKLWRFEWITLLSIIWRHFYRVWIEWWAGKKILTNNVNIARRGYSLKSVVSVCAAPSGRLFAPFWSENEYTLCPYWSGIGFSRELRECMKRIYHFNSKWVRKKEKHGNSKGVWRIFLVCALIQVKIT